MTDTIGTVNAEEENSVPVQRLISRIESRGYGKVVRVLSVMKIMNIGWDLDNLAIVVEFDNGNIHAFDTDHGRLRIYSKEEAIMKLEETQASADTISKVIEIWPTI